MSANGPGHTAPNKFGSWTREEEMMDGLILITKLTSWIAQPTPLNHCVFSGNSIVPDQPEPNFNL
jgi:hypothetical protein